MNLYYNFWNNADAIQHGVFFIFKKERKKEETFL